MRVWRISNYADLRGLGGIRAGGRWHSPGQPIVYAADHPAAALLEKLVHFEFESTQDLPRTYQLLEIEIPRSLKTSSAGPKELGTDWHAEESRTRAIGDRWLRAAQTSVLVVPSAITPHALNYIINPRHRDFDKIKIVSAARYPFDVRLFKIV
jgi:RES domain-containing protein